MPNLPYISPDLIAQYQNQLARTTTLTTAKRKMASLKKFFDWAHDKGHIKENPLLTAKPLVSAFEAPKRSKVGVKSLAGVGVLALSVLLIFLLARKLQLPIPFLPAPASENRVTQLPQPTGNLSQSPAPNIPGAPSTTTLLSPWTIFAKMTLTDASGSAVLGAQAVTFRLYKSPDDPTPLWTSDTKQETPDANGNIAIALDNVPTNVFFGNDRLYLGANIGGTEIKDRIPVSSANSAANLQGYTPAQPETGAGPGTIPVIADDGSLILASQAPAIKAKQGNLLVEGQTVTLATAAGSDGNIEINPNGFGYAHFLFEGTGNNFLNAQAPNLTSGSLYYGVVANGATGYDLIRLQSGSNPVTRFSVDASGNTNQTGNLSTSGTQRLSSAGGLANITGYSQTSGNFVITQNPGNYSAITQTGSALADLMTLTLDERNKANSNYSTLTLNRYNGWSEAAALYVKNGTVILNDQLQLGRFATLPTAIGLGSIVYNTSDNQLYFWNGISWVSTATSSLSFTNITSGTNTTAAMVVGSGASLNYTGTGTINASTLIGSTWAAPAAIGSTTPNSGAFTTLSASGTVNLSALTASKVVFTDASKNLTSTGTVGADQGGTGFSSYTVGDLLYADTTTTLVRLNDIATGNVLISGGISTAPSWGKVVLGTHTTGNYVSSATGTTNQVTVSPTTGDVVISIPSDFRAPGTVNAVSGLYTGATAGTQRIDASGNLTSIGTTQLNGVTYTWPASATATYVLQSQNTGTSSTLSWVDPAAAASGAIYWTQGAGVLYPKNSTVDVLIGANSTASAKFAFMNVNSGNPTASISGNIALGAPTTTTAPTTFLNIYNGGSFNIQGSVGGDAVLTSRLYIDSGGRVGINTNAPGAQLDVTGMGRFSSTLTASNGLTLTTGALNLTGTSGTLTLSGLGASSVSFGVNNILFTSGNFNTTATGINSTAIGATTPSTGAFTTLSSSGNTTLSSGAGATAAIGNATGTFAVTSTALNVTTAGAVSGVTTLSMSNQLTNSYANSAAFNLTGNGAGMTFTGTGPNQIITAASQNLALMPGGNLGVGTTSPSEKLDVSGNATVSGNLTFYGGARSIQATLSLDLTIGGNTTGNIILNPLNAGAGGAVKPGANNVSDLGISGTAWRNIWGITVYQNGNQVCDTSGNCLGSANDLWTQATGALYPKNSTVDVLIGATATPSAKFGFLNVNSGTPTASISGTTANVAAYLTGNGNLATTNMADLTIGGSSTGNIFLQPLSTATGKVQIGAGGAGSSTPDLLVLDVKSDAGDPTGTNGAMYYNSNSGKLRCYQAGAWGDCGAGTGTGGSNWVLGSGILYPINSTVDVLVGGTSTASAKFAFMNVNSGNPTASISGNIAMGAPTTTTAPSTFFNIYNGGSFNIQGSVGGDAVLTSRIYIDSGGKVGINTNSPGAQLDVNGSLLLGANSTLDTRSAGSLGIGTGTQTALTLGRSLAATSFIGSNVSLGGMAYGGASNTMQFTSGATSGMVKIIAGNAPSTVNSTQNYVAYWSDANTISGEQYLATSRGGLGANVTAAGAGELLYSSGTTAYGHLAAGTSGMALISGGAASPSWGTLGLVYGGTAADLSAVAQGSLIYKGASALAGTGALSGIVQGNGSGIPTAITGTTNYIPKWAAAAPYLTATSLIYDNGTAVGVGTAAPLSRLHVATDTVNLTGKAALIVDQLEDQDILAASASGQAKFAVRKGLSAGEYDTYIDKYLKTYRNSVNVINFFNNGVSWESYLSAVFALDNDNNDTTEKFQIVTNGGQSTLFTVLQNGASGNAAKPMVAIGSHTPITYLDVRGATTGKALAIFDEQGDQNILTASASSTTVLNITRSGDVVASGQIHPGNYASNPTTVGAGSIYYNTGDTNLYYDKAGTWTQIGGGGATGWTFSNPYIYTTSADYRVGIGTTTTGDIISKLYVSNGSTLTGKALAIFNQPENQDIIAASASSTPKFVVSKNGDVTATGALQVGAAWSPTILTAYSRFGSTATTHTLTTPYDVLIGGNLELNGSLFLNGATITDSAGTGVFVLTASPTTLRETLTGSAWLVENTAQVGEAALQVNQKLGGDIFTASTSGSPKFVIANSGSVTIRPGDTSGAVMLTAGDGTGKINVGTVDPIYNIGGTKYATYLSGMTGVKEETTGNVSTSEYVPGIGYRQSIDFKDATTGSDLWLFAKATNLQNNIGKMVVLLSPSQNTRAWYEVDTQNYILSVYTARPSTVSYRLTAPRFDYASWSNYNYDEGVNGFNIKDENLAVNPNGDIKPAPVPSLADFQISKSPNSLGYQLQTTAGQIIDELGAFGNLIAANIQAGAISVSELTANLLTTNKIVSPLADIDTVRTSMISPLADKTDVAIQIGSTATPEGQLVIKNSSGSAVASVDTGGNASFSGTLYAEKIKSTTLDDINKLLHQVQQDQNLLAQASSWNANTATGSAVANLQNLFVTNQAAINSLSVTTAVTIGTDLVLQSSLGTSSQQLSAINTLTAPLALQSLAMAPVEIMAGKVKIDTNGDVTIQGNLYVAGRIESSGLAIKPSSGPQLSAATPLASIDASGSAIFNSVSADKFILAAQAATQSADVNGEITTNATAGQAVIKAGVTEITIKNPSISDYTLVYVTPTSSTLNNVLYVKSKGSGYFTVGFSNPLTVDVTFNWWVIEVKQ